MGFVSCKRGRSILKVLALNYGMKLRCWLLHALRNCKKDHQFSNPGLHTVIQSCQVHNTRILEIAAGFYFLHHGKKVISQNKFLRTTC